MANWQKLATAVLLADGKIDDAETKILRKELYEDGVIDKQEVDFLIDLRNKAKGNVSPAFTKFFFKAIQDNVLEDGGIDADEAAWLRKMLYADKKIDANEKKFLTALKKKATKTSPAFDKLYEECMKK